MDIHAGASICIGYNNFLEKFYRSVPVGITVEGSNTLTRSLIIFGQGLNKSHPYIFKILDTILDNNLENFKKEFNNIVKHSIILYCNISEKLTDYIINEIIDENQIKINNIVDNLPFNYLLFHLKNKPRSRNYYKEALIFDEIMNNNAIIDTIKKDIYYDNTIIKDMEDINMIEDKNNSIVDKLKDDIINVDEYVIN